ncbi:MAG: MoaD/ThiS family protein, partial [Nitrososphaerota archaeon]|nr:MoaD/ThiS family protein [Nitrososphaerota archaeon]
MTCERWSDSVECTLKVLLFASAREAVGRGELTVPYSRGESLADLLGRLRADYPSLAKMSHYRFALNGEFVSGDLARVRLENAVELALLPPYSGGVNRAEDPSQHLGGHYPLPPHTGAGLAAAYGPFFGRGCDIRGSGPPRRSGTRSFPGNRSHGARIRGLPSFGAARA